MQREGENERKWVGKGGRLGEGKMEGERERKMEGEGRDR